MRRSRSLCCLEHDGAKAIHESGAMRIPFSLEARTNPIPEVA